MHTEIIYKRTHSITINCFSCFYMIKGNQTFKTILTVKYTDK